MFESRTERTGLESRGDFSKQPWHFDVENTYRELDADDGGFLRGLFRRRWRTRAEREREKISQFMSVGGMRHERRNALEEERPYLRKGRVVRWLVILAAVWTVFRFVSL